MSLQPGTRIGNYEILSAIGAGGMGEVFRARDRKLDRHQGESEPSGVFPLFWTERGIYARSGRGLLLCDESASTCSLVYSLDKNRFAFAGTAVGQDRALLLVQDHRLDPFETMAKEIHEVDLKTGEGHRLMRLPNRLLLWDIDWIDDSMPLAPSESE